MREIDAALTAILAQSDADRCLLEPKHACLPTTGDKQRMQAAMKRLGLAQATGDSTTRLHDWDYQLGFWTREESVSLAKSA